MVVNGYGGAFSATVARSGQLRISPVRPEVMVSDERHATMKSVFRLAARRTCFAGRTPKLESAPVSEKRIGLNRSPDNQVHGD
jgi:hypothetical protein